MKSAAVNPPLIAERKGIIPFHELFRLYKLWVESGRNLNQPDLTQAAEDLWKWLGPLFQKKSFQALWCKEDAYTEVDIPQIAVKSGDFSYSKMGLHLYCKDPFSVVTTLVGHHTSLGVIATENVEIRAFGPHSGPLCDSKGFGIYRLPDGEAIERWTACASYPEIWFDVDSQYKENFFQLGLKFLGLNEKKPLYFVFYVKAKQAEIDSQIFKPRELQRYHADNKPVVFGETLSIEGGNLSNMELIPLAGDGCFWNSDFLLAFEIPSCNDVISFKIFSDPLLRMDAGKISS